MGFRRLPEGGGSHFTSCCSIARAAREQLDGATAALSQSLAVTLSMMLCRPAVRLRTTIGSSNTGSHTRRCNPTTPIEEARLFRIIHRARGLRALRQIVARILRVERPAALLSDNSTRRGFRTVFSVNKGLLRGRLQLNLLARCGPPEGANPGCWRSTRSICLRPVTPLASETVFRTSTIFAVVRAKPPQAFLCAHGPRA